MKNHQYIDDGPQAKKIKLEMPSFHFDSEESTSHAVYMLDKKMKDSIAHKIIEKKRRDRINKYLNELCHLIPATANRKGKMEKAEILYQSVKHIRYLQSRTAAGQVAELGKREIGERKQTQHRSDFKMPVLEKSSAESEVPPIIYGDKVETGEKSYGISGTKPLRDLNKTLSSTAIGGSQITSNIVCNDNSCKDEENVHANQATAACKEPEHCANRLRLPLKKRDWSRSQTLKTKYIAKKNDLPEMTLRQNNVSQTTESIKPLVNSGCCDDILDKVESGVPLHHTPNRDVDTASDPKHHSMGYSYVSNIHPVLSRGVPVLALHPSGSHFVPFAIHPTHLASAIENSTEFGPINNMALSNQPTNGFPCVPPNMFSQSHHYPADLENLSYPHLTYAHGASSFSQSPRQCQNVPTCPRLYSLSSSMPCLSSATSHFPLCQVNSPNPCYAAAPVSPCQIHSNHSAYSCRGHINSRTYTH